MVVTAFVAGLALQIRQLATRVFGALWAQGVQGSVQPSVPKYRGGVRECAARHLPGPALQSVPAVSQECLECSEHLSDLFDCPKPVGRRSLDGPRFWSWFSADGQSISIMICLVYVQSTSLLIEGVAMRVSMCFCEEIAIKIGNSAHER